MKTIIGLAPVRDLSFTPIPLDQEIPVFEDVNETIECDAVYFAQTYAKTREHWGMYLEAFDKWLEFYLRRKR